MSRHPRLSAPAIVTAYAIVAGLWIAFSDRVASALAPSQEALTTISTVKGWGFVLVTSALLGLLLVGFSAERVRRTEELERLNRVLRTLGLASQELIRADNETALLQSFCSIVVEQGAFLGAWVGYRDDDPPGTIRPIAWAGPVEQYLKEISLSWLDPARGSAGPGGTSIREGRTVVGKDVAADATLAWRSEMLAQGFRALAALPLTIDGLAFGTLVIYAGDARSFAPDELALLEELASDLAFGVRTLRARVAASQLEAERRRLAVAVEQSAEAVVITDTEARIEYVNSAFERASGYSRDEVIGLNPRILQSGQQSPGFYASMWAVLSGGNTFVGNLVNRRKDGSLYHEEAVISPIRDEAGVITSYVAAQRDVTHERALEAAHERMTRERAMIAGTLADLPVLPTAPATAEAICRQIIGLSGVATASLAYFTLEGPALALAFLRADGVPVRLRRLPFQRSRTLKERAEEGPWVEAWVRRPWHPYDKLHQELATKALAYAPVRQGGRLIGIITVTSAEDDAVARLTESLPALLEFAGFAGALVGPAIADLTEVGRGRERIAEVIRSGAFSSVFQPVVDLGTGTLAGYEALTRFSSGTAPDLVFADARAVGIEPELELATLERAITSAVILPAEAWLSLNVSPDLLTTNRQLAPLLRTTDRPIVLEVTEHVPVGDYGALRAAIGRLGESVRVAVDDAGAGVANFAHIVELRPAFVKLDMRLVRGIEADRTRQALILGLLQFASESMSQTIAEGVETEEELATLRELGVPFAQGYLLAMPAPAETWAAPAEG